MMGEMPIQIAGQHFMLNTLHTMFWKQQHALMVADMHIGKAAHFRKHGIALPAHYLSDDFARLSASIKHYQVSALYILGDLIHADHNRELLMFEQWLQQHADIECHLILGNHDRHTEAWLKTLPLQIHSEKLLLSGCLLTHKPEESDSHLVISGHIHPGIALTSVQRQKIRVPAFLVNEQQIILPAFSAFTGLDTSFVQGKKFNAYAITKEKIIKL
jgi:DNA ligase-associated metallophosphoesterase